MARTNGWLALIIGLGLAGCATASPDRQTTLAGACQMRSCECMEAGSLTPFAERRPVEWRINGDAYCPDGFQLQIKR